MSKYILIIVGIVIIVAAAGWFIVSQPGAEPNSVESLTKAPDFRLKDYNGNYNSLSDFKGKALVINSWAAWCPFCVDELPDFAIAQEEFKDKVIIIAIDRAESLSIAKKFTDKYKVTEKLVFLMDPGDSFYRSIGGFTMPETIFVDKNGNIRDHKRGIMDLNEIRQKITNPLEISNE